MRDVSRGIELYTLVRCINDGEVTSIPAAHTMKVMVPEYGIYASLPVQSCDHRSTSRKILDGAKADA